MMSQNFYDETNNKIAYLSYKRPTDVREHRYCFIVGDAIHRLKLNRVDIDMTVLIYLDANEQATQFPKGFAVLNQSNNGTPAPMLDGKYILFYANNYSVQFNGDVILDIHNQRLQAVFSYILE